MKNSKKIIVLLTILTLISTDLFAQRGGGGQRGGGPQGGRPEQGAQQGNRVNPLAATGYFDFDALDVIDKLQIEEKDVTSKLLTVFDNYEKEKKSVGENFKTEIEQINKSQKVAMEAMKSQDFETLRALREDNQGKNEELVKAMSVVHENLNQNISSVLVGPYIKSWKRYYSAECHQNGYSPMKDKNNKKDKNSKRARGEK